MRTTMATVTYHHQPAIHKTRGKIPLAGTSHLYTVSKVLWPDAIEDFLESQFIGRTLHVCCGKSRIGDILVDRYEPNVTVCADGAALPFRDRSVDTVLCDPPYNSKLRWNHDLLSEISRVASRRIIFQHWFIPANPRGGYKKANEHFYLSAVYVWQGKTYFGRAQIISIFDRYTAENP